MSSPTIPCSGLRNEASGVANTMIWAVTLTSRVTPKAIGHMLRPSRCTPSAFQPSFE